MPRGRVTVTVRRPTTTKDRYGNTTAGDPTEHQLEGCDLQPLIGSEDADPGTVVTRWQLFGPHAGDVLSTDQIVVDGDVYDVEGDVQRWPGRKGYLTAILQRAT